MHSVTATLTVDLENRPTKRSIQSLSKIWRGWVSMAARTKSLTSMSGGVSFRARWAISSKSFILSKVVDSVALELVLELFLGSKGFDLCLGQAPVQFVRNLLKGKLLQVLEGDYKFFVRLEMFE